jgi:hypothetical protein
MEADGRRPEPRPMPAPIKWMLIALLTLPGPVRYQGAGLVPVAYTIGTNDDLFVAS